MVSLLTYCLEFSQLVILWNIGESSCAIFLIRKMEGRERREVGGLNWVDEEEWRRSAWVGILKTLVREREGGNGCRVSDKYSLSQYRDRKCSPWDSYWKVNNEMAKGSKTQTIALTKLQCPPKFKILH